MKEECKIEKEFNCIVVIEVLIFFLFGYCLINKKIFDVKDKRLKLLSEGGVKGFVIGEKILFLLNNKLRYFIILLLEFIWFLFSVNILKL